MTLCGRDGCRDYENMITKEFTGNANACSLFFRKEYIGFIVDCKAVTINCTKIALAVSKLPFIDSSVSRIPHLYHWGVRRPPFPILS